MKFATLKNGTRDGTLVLVSKDNTQATYATDIAHTRCKTHWTTGKPKPRNFKNVTMS